MKKIIIGLLALSANSVFAGELKYENLPLVKERVYSVARVDLVDAKHERDQQNSLINLRAHVENTLGRQVIEVKCDTPIKDTFDNKDVASRKSTCSASFL